MYPHFMVVLSPGSFFRQVSVVPAGSRKAPAGEVISWVMVPAKRGSEGGFGGGPFGVRRPLRFLAYKLGLDEKQVAELARVLDELKTERAQAEVDNRRTLAEFADALAGEAFDAAKAAAAGERRVDSAAKVARHARPQPPADPRHP